MNSPRAVISFGFFALASALAVACGSEGTDGTRRSLGSLDSCAANDPSCQPRTGPTGSPVLADDAAAGPPVEASDAAPAPDAAEPEPNPVAADDCSPAALANAGVIQVRAGTPSIFTVPFGGATDTFKSGCIFASGPDRIQPLMPMTGTRMRIVIESTKSIVGPVVLYAKETCGGTQDLACSFKGPIELPIVPGTTYYVHFDSLSVQAADSRVTANVEVF
jgi:hypothetical protein